MRVQMVVQISGTRDGKPWPGRGETFDVDDAEGAQLCASRMAIPVADLSVETASVEPARNAARTRKAGNK